uniref:Uncharacterized protein TCIL3000_11_1740 n=1 Tax=Trypanosoma congolense (strain IL3000) TaxID=1068625 RepID=G0UZH1_TRYCI|nr:unnamed protein product [Trypanosoma congolense IL3000]
MFFFFCVARLRQRFCPNTALQRICFLHVLIIFFFRCSPPATHFSLIFIHEYIYFIASTLKQRISFIFLLYGCCEMLWEPLCGAVVAREIRRGGAVVRRLGCLTEGQRGIIMIRLLLMPFQTVNFIDCHDSNGDRLFVCVWDGFMFPVLKGRKKQNRIYGVGKTPYGCLFPVNLGDCHRHFISTVDCIFNLLRCR